MTDSLQINGLLHHLPQNLNNGAVQVYQEGTNDVITTDFGLRVTYDLVYHITVTVPGNYRGKTCGLCGNFDDSSTDDFELQDGTMTNNLQTFGAAWKVPVPGVVCEDGCSGDICPKCDESETAAIEAKCSIITDSTGPFAACQSVIDPAPYFRDCVYDVCMDNDNQTMLCHSIAAYMLDCQDFGVKVQNWRSASFCRESTHLYYFIVHLMSTQTSNLFNIFLFICCKKTPPSCYFFYSLYMQGWQPL